MSKSRPKSHPKSRKGSLKKGKHGGLADKTVKEQKPIYHFVLEFFLLLFLKLWEFAGRMLFRFGSRGKKKEPSLSRARPDASSSSSALAAPCGASVAAKRASEEQTEGPAVERLSFGTVNDKDPCHDPNSTGDSTEALTLDPEVLEAVFSSNGVMVGEIFCPDQVGFRKLKQEEAKVDLLKRLPVEQIEKDEIKSERPGSDSGYRKKEHDGMEDHLKKKREIFYTSLQLRQVLSNFQKKPERNIMDDRLKEEVLELPAAKSESIDRIIVKASYSKILRTIFFQRANMALKSSFCSIVWRNDNRFPNFNNDDADYYQWWEQNFDPEILEKRLEILRVAAEKLAEKSNPKLDMFMIIKRVSDLNSELHPQPSENELHEKDEVKMSRLLTRICDLDSGGDSKI